jgi:hypothetical protein
VKLSASHRPDRSPGTFDPGDVWVFTCLSTTPHGGADCTPSSVVNTATAQATKLGVTVSDEDAWETALTCEPPPTETPPTEPIPPTPDLPPDATSPPSLLPDGITPPPAGAAGTGGTHLGDCLRRGSLVRLGVSRASSVALFVSGRRVRGVSVRPLQSRIAIRVRRSFKPGVHRVTAVVRFQRGAGTPSLRLSSQVRVCAARLRSPSFTG